VARARKDGKGKRNRSNLVKWAKINAKNNEILKKLKENAEG
jgi:hypothetical protein